MRLLQPSGHSLAEEKRAASERDFAPIAVVDVELSAAIDAIPATDAAGRRYGGARVLVRLHTRPLGLVDLTVGANGVTPAACAAAIWDALGPKVNEHLRDDGLPEVTQIEPLGLPGVVSPPCVRRREALLRNAPAASVILCTRDRAGLLGRCLRSLEALEYPDVEIIVVDGSSTADTASLVRDQFPHIRYLNVGSNRKCFALNRGLEAASGTVVAFTDDDVVVDGHWLAELAAGLNSDQRVACTTGAVVPLELQTQAQLWFEESGAFTEGFERRVIGLEMARAPGSLLPYATGRIGVGASMAWQTSVLRELGGFDVALDTLKPPWPLRSRPRSATMDLAAFFDTLVNGFQIAFEPGAIVYHEHRRTYEELSRQLYWHGIGLGAYLTRCIFTRPAQIPAFIRRVPRGALYGFAEGSPRHRNKSRDFPRELTRAERRGVVYGPLAYIRGLPMARRLRAVERRQSVAAPDAR